MKREDYCIHEWMRISNNWFHWNTGEVMTTGRCIKCGIIREIPYKFIKNVEFKLKEDERE